MAAYQHETIQQLSETKKIEQLIFSNLSGVPKKFGSINVSFEGEHRYFVRNENGLLIDPRNQDKSNNLD